MSTPQTFGRRTAPPPETAADDPRLDALRRELAAPREDGFATWRAAQRPKRLALWLASFALAGAGVGSQLLDVAGSLLDIPTPEVPLHVSLALGVAGLGLGWWLRRERRRQLGEISRWSEDAPI